jgi:hypothetical protein
VEKSFDFPRRCNFCLAGSVLGVVHLPLLGSLGFTDPASVC